MDEEDENQISIKSVKLPTFTGTHVEFQAWWFCFQAWIGDTAAMMDMTPHNIGTVNKHAAKESVSIIMGNKQVEKSIAIGDLPSIICNNHKQCRLCRPQ